VPRPLRSAYILGIAGLLVVMSSTGALVGFFVASVVPPVLSAALLFMMPIYFTLSMLAGARTLAAVMPVVLGLLLGPLFHLVVPDFDLMLTGLIGGTAGFLAMRHQEKRRGRP
jgi:predicted branched-subunit amino acid permease